MSDRLSEIEGRLAAATPGPWKAVKTHKGYPTENYVVRDDLLGVAMQYALVWQPGDADFIANAPDDLAALLRFVREVDQITSDREPNLTFADAIVMIRVALKKLAKA